jgi:hypothetical protein
VSGRLRVRDFDQADAYDRWAAAHTEMAAAVPTARTSRGYHVYFRADLPDRVTKFADGELRAGKCVTVLPPSAHPDGRAYEWVRPPAAAIPEVPDVAAAGLLGPAPSGGLGPGQAVPADVGAAIAASLPTVQGERHDKVFEFARRLKGIPDLDTSTRALAGYIREWHRQALPVIRTKAFAKTELDFHDAWLNAKVPLTDDQFGSLVDKALAGPEPAWFEDWFFPESGKLLLRVCMGLQAHAGDGPFFLSARKAGEVCGLCPLDALYMLNKLAKVGHLVLVEKGELSGLKASTWRCPTTAG